VTGARQALYVALLAHYAAALQAVLDAELLWRTQ
jgi:hypothetical protein